MIDVLQSKHTYAATSQVKRTLRGLTVSSVTPGTLPSCWMRLGRHSWMMRQHIEAEGAMWRSTEEPDSEWSFLRTSCSPSYSWMQLSEWPSPLLHGAQKMPSWVLPESLTERIVRVAFFLFAYIVLFWCHLKLKSCKYTTKNFFPNHLRVKLLTCPHTRNTYEFISTIQPLQSGN